MGLDHGCPNAAELQQEENSGNPPRAPLRGEPEVPNTATSRHYYSPEMTSESDEKLQSHPLPLCLFQRHFQDPEFPHLPQGFGGIWGDGGSRAGVAGQPTWDHLCVPQGVMFQNITEMGVRKNKLWRHQSPHMSKAWALQKRGKQENYSSFHVPQLICFAGENPFPSTLGKRQNLYLSVYSLILSSLISWPFCQKIFITIIVWCGDRAMLLNWGPFCSPQDMWQCLKMLLLLHLGGEVLLASSE